MKLNRKTSAWLLALGTSLAGFVPTASAITTLSVGFQATLASEGNPLAKRPGSTNNAEGGPYRVSVNPSNPGYATIGAANLPGTSTAAPAFQRAFDEPIRAWRWVGGGANNVLTQNVRTDGSPRISYTTTDTVFDGFAQDQLALWTTNNPGANLITTAVAPNFTGPGYRDFGQIAATIDVSGLGTGTVNIFYGAFNTRPTVSVVMKDLAGVAPDLTVANVHLNNDTANRGEYYVAEVDFSTDGIYDVIQYTWLSNGLNDTGNGRFGGTVLTGTTFVATVVPEPATASLALLGLGGLMMRRRRQATV